MLTLLAGENSYEVSRELGRVVADFGGEAEKYDGTELNAEDLPDLFMGQSLFSSKRLIIIRNLSLNKPVWGELGNWLERLGDDSRIVLVEAKPDKRTKTYKELKKIASVHEYHPWGEHDSAKAEAWAVKQAKEKGVVLSSGLARQLVWRTGTDQWDIHHALEKLSLLSGELNEEVLNDAVPQTPRESVFQLLETALSGDKPRLDQMILALKQTEEPHMVMGLLAGQAFWLAALATAGPDDNVAKDIGANPYGLNKLRPFVRHLGLAGTRSVVAAVADGDYRLKTSGGAPWMIIELALGNILLLGSKNPR